MVCRVYVNNGFVVVVGRNVISLYFNSRKVGEYDNEQEALNNTSTRKLPLYRHPDI